MFDGISIKHIEFLNKKKFYNHFELSQVTNLNTGETTGNKFAKEKGLQFTINNNNTKMRGSLHKYKNNGLHNRDNFTFKEVCNVVTELKNIYGINTDTTKINTVEFGLNIVPGFNINTFLKRLLTHKNIRFNRERNKENELFYVAKHYEYDVKMYSKGNGILRFEIKPNRNRYFKKIKVLTDLTKKDVWQLAYKELIKEFDNIIYWDDLKKHTPNKIKQYLNEKQNLQYLETSKRNKFKELNKYREYLQKYGVNDYHKLTHLLNEKYNKLINSEVTQKNGCKFTYFETTDKVNENPQKTTKKEQLTTLNKNENYNKLINNEVTQKNGCKFTYFGTPNKVQIHILDKMGKCTQPKCKVTGLDISMQKKGSKFLSLTGVEFYHKNHPDIYKELEKRLSNYWDNEPLKVRFKEIAHQIRNEYNNTLYSEKKKVKKITSYPILFAVKDVLNFKYLEPKVVNKKVV